MRPTHHPVLRACLLLTALPLVTAIASATQQGQETFEPQSGQAGKDVVWVPTPPALVEKMLDMAKVTSADFVMDLGSGDGRNVIAAAKRGARAVGVEYNPQMVALSRRNAEKAGVSDKATFVEGDMYEADISKATALVLFLLPTNLERLTPKFLDLHPGTRIVDNTFAIPGWSPDESQQIEADCSAWCTSLLWIVPAKVAGVWSGSHGELTLKQEFQMVSGTLGSGSSATTVESGRLRGDQLSFRAGAIEFTGRVKGDRIEGRATSPSGDQSWTLTRSQ